jgi:23S rRNA (guanosine2251-2'-O)-methyltransferase
MLQIEGRNPVIESLRAGKKIEKIYLEQEINHDEKITEIIKLAHKQGINLIYKPKKFMTRVSHTSVHQGVIAFKTEEPDMSLKQLLEKFVQERKDPFIIYIREALYEHNLGAIIRTAECAGADAVITTPKETITSSVARAAMGATEHIAIIRESLFNAIKTAKSYGLKVAGIEVAGTEYYYNSDLKGPMMLIIGGEDRSLSEEILNKCDLVVKIPLLGKVNSLNMSVAAAIVIYDKIRQESVKN